MVFIYFNHRTIFLYTINPRDCGCIVCLCLVSRNLFINQKIQLLMDNESKSFVAGVLAALTQPNPEQPAVKQYKCSVKDCPNCAKHEIVWHLKSRRNDPPTPTTVLARVCDSHNNNLHDKFFDRITWYEMSAAMNEMGMRKPKTNYSLLVAQPIGTSAATRPKTKRGTGFTMQ